VRADVERVRAEPDEVAGDPRELRHDDAHVHRPLGDRVLDAEQLLHRLHVGQVVRRRRQVVHAIRVRHVLVILVDLRELLRAAVQVADVRRRLPDVLAVEVQQHAEHPVRARVLRSHIDDELLLLELVDVESSAHRSPKERATSDER
jgi:hypothetical protein